MPFTEHSKTLNPNLKGRDIREAFKGDEYQILLVANKFQTGFDQPLLCGMYVDKRLAASRPCRRSRASTARIPARTRPTSWTS
jgi:type I site-specific restriction-modification system R (restriction) subunit